MGKAPAYRQAGVASWLTPQWGDISRLAPGQAVLKLRIEVSRLTAELPGEEVSFHYMPFIQRACTGQPRPSRRRRDCCRGTISIEASSG
jgi:hypothetical protein